MSKKTLVSILSAIVLFNASPKSYALENPPPESCLEISEEAMSDNGGRVYFFNKKECSAVAFVEYAPPKKVDGREKTKFISEVYDFNNDGIFNGKDFYYIPSDKGKAIKGINKKIGQRLLDRLRGYFSKC